MKLIALFTFFILTACSQGTIRKIAQCDKDCGEKTPRTCLVYREALNQIDLSNDTNFNRIGQENTGFGECVREVLLLNPIELQSEFDISHQHEKLSCGGTIYKKATYEHKEDKACYIASIITQIYIRDIDERETGPRCHELTQLRFSKTVLSDYQVAIYTQRCQREVQKEWSKQNRIYQEPRNTNVSHGKTFRPKCTESATPVECKNEVLKIASDSGCFETQFSCNGNKAFCNWSSKNCSPAVNFEKWPLNNVDSKAPECLVNDDIVKIGNGDANASPLGGFLCKWNLK